MKRIFTAFLTMLFVGSLLLAQAPKVILITPDDRDDAQYEFLMRNGFDVEKFFPGSSLAAAGQDTIDKLNAADLIIVGRSPNSGDFDGDDEPVWNALTAPLIVNSQWVARSHRMGMLNSRSAYHQNEVPEVAYGMALLPADPIFANATLDGDSMAWCMAPHDFIQNNDSATNGTIVAMYDATSPLIVRWDAGTLYYPGSTIMPAGPRTYFGFGNDDLVNLGVETVPNMFPLTADAKAVYLAEICTMTGIPVQVPVFGVEDARIILVTPDDRDDEQFNFLVNQGFYVSKFFPGSSLAAAGQDTIDKLNAADLVIVGRSPNSGDFDGDDEPVWNALTVPLIVNSQWVARSHRIGMFNSRSAYHENETPLMAYGSVLEPTDDIFAGVTLMGDSVGWCVAPHDFIQNNDSATNGTILVMYDGTTPLVARWDAGTAYYEGGFTPAGPRTYFGFGNDDLVNLGVEMHPNFFPLTKESKQVYLAEICQMVGIDAAQVPDAVFTASDYSVTFITDDDDDDAQINWLKKNNIHVNEFFPGPSLAAAGQDTIDMLNASDLIIVGRSPSSGDFDGDDEPVWNALTAPLIINSQWVARSHRIGMFNSRSAYHENDEPMIAYATTTMPDDEAFTDVTVGDSLGWCIVPHDFLENNDSATNGTILAMYNMTSPLFARWEAGTPYYEGGFTPAGPRTYFGFGNDDMRNLGYWVGPNNFPLTEDAQQVYYNEISLMLGAELSEVMTVTSDASLDSLTWDVAEAVLSPEFNKDSMSYMLQMPEGVSVVTLKAHPASEYATTVGDSTIDVSARDTITTKIAVTAESGNEMQYVVTVYPDLTGVGVEEEEMVSAEIRLYPNPVSDLLYVESDMEITRVTVYNVVGEAILHVTDLHDSRVQLNVGELTPGLYMIRVNNGEQSSITKFLKR